MVYGVLSLSSACLEMPQNAQTTEIRSLYCCLRVALKVNFNFINANSECCSCMKTYEVQ